MLDETERQALQEAEDERIARELEEKEQRRILAEVLVYKCVCVCVCECVCLCEWMGYYAVRKSALKSHFIHF